MIRPYRLSIEALDVLRAFVRAGAKTEGGRLPVDALPNGPEDPAVAELRRAELVAGAPGARELTLTSDGERFFARYLRSCHQ